MNRKRTKPFILIPLLGKVWASVGLIALLSALFTVNTAAQTAGGSGVEQPRNLNSELRTRTFSIYAQGGVSWATGVWYHSLDSKRSYKVSPAVGGGIDFTIRPWVRVGAEYLWSRYRREQRYSLLETGTMPVKTYGNYLMNYHNVKVGGQFNVMELWPRRRAQWLNIWVGTGLGYTFARGNEHGIYMSNTKTLGGETTPFVNGETVSNDGTVTFTGHVSTTNRHEHFNKLYIPTSLHVEADVSRQFTVGLKGEVDWLLNRKDIAPRNLYLAMVTVRYNFVPSRAKAQRAYYEDRLSSLNDRVNILQQEAERERARADREASGKAALEQQNNDLKRRLQDCENSKTKYCTAQPAVHFVQFAHNSSFMSRAEADRLKAFAQSVREKTLSIVAEASTPGSERYNQKLSERRLDRVMKVLIKEGFSKNNLHPTTAIGEKNGKRDAEGRRVTIKVVVNK